jgi:hypothetical protein
MTQFPARRFVLLCLMAALVALLTSCGGNKKDTETLLTPAEASDLMQLIGVMTGADSGGVFVEIQSTFDGTPRTFPALALESVARDTTFPAGLVNWDVRVLYNSTHGVSQDVFTDSTVAMDVTASAAGHIGVGLSNGAFGYVNDTLNVTGLSPSDTVLTYAGFSVADSALLSIPGGSAGAPFYFLDNVVEYSVEFDKIGGQGHYPKRGEMRIDVLAEQLHSATHTDVMRSLPDALVVITFDGTPNALAEITTITDHTVAPVYRYHLNLKTGVISP